MSSNTSGYNYCLDFIKGLACVCVVFMHCEFPGRLGVLVQAVSRFCVPFFFMVSGYFSRPEKENIDSDSHWSWLFNRKVIHIAKITLWATLFYLIWAAIRFFFWREVESDFSLLGIAAWLCFNRPVLIAGHLWFLYALLYDYVLISIMDRTKVKKYEFVLGSLALVLLVILGQGIHLLGIHIPNFIYRNWLIEGFGFFMLGRWVYTIKDQIQLSNAALLTIVSVSTVMCILERKLFGRDFGVNICTIPQVIALFLYAVKNPMRHLGFIQVAGRDYSMMVYILHIFVYQVLAKIYQATSIDNNILALSLLPILVVACSFLLTWGYNHMLASLAQKS